ncbi:hypothetical protein FB451DRAFT_1554794 [Mycena latifolia]|nr:hypothetical protein FB451DRAFT_1554794 [Mycena latifolia]
MSIGSGLSERILVHDLEWHIYAPALEVAEEQVYGDQDSMPRARAFSPPRSGRIHHPHSRGPPRLSTLQPRDLHLMLMRLPARLSISSKLVRASFSVATDALSGTTPHTCDLNCVLLPLAPLRLDALPPPPPPPRSSRWLPPPCPPAHLPLIASPFFLWRGSHAAEGQTRSAIARPPWREKGDLRGMKTAVIAHAVSPLLAREELADMLHIQYHPRPSLARANITSDTRPIPVTRPAVPTEAFSWYYAACLQVATLCLSFTASWRGQGTRSPTPDVINTDIQLTNGVMNGHTVVPSSQPLRIQESRDLPHPADNPDSLSRFYETPDQPHTMHMVF